MTYIPQYIDSRGDCYCVIPLAGHSSWVIFNPGTGYLPSDVGATISIPIIQSGQVPAQCKITAVTDGGITGVSEFVAGGNYSNGGLYSGQAMAITGGSGTGCTVQVSSNYVPFYTEDVGFGSSFSQLTAYINVFDFVFTPSFWMDGYAGGIKLQFTGQSSLYNGNEYLQVQLMDVQGIIIFDGSYIRPTQQTKVQVIQNAFWDILLCLDTSTQTIHVFVNDVEWVLDYTPGFYPPDYTRRPRSAGWTPGNTGPISNPYGSIPGWKIQGVGGGFASLWMSPTYTDMTVESNRRMFTTGNNVGWTGTWIDPATFPPAPVNLYLLQGDAPTNFQNNHGTAPVPWKGTSLNAPFMFFMTYWTSAFAKTHVNTPYTAHIPGGTVRPGAVIAPKPSGSYPGYGASNGTITVSGEYYTFTPRPDFVGFGEVYFSLMEIMPAGYAQPLFPGGSVGVGSPICIDAGVIPEARRTSVPLHTLPYRGGFLEIEDFQFPARFYDRAMVLVRSDETLDDDANPYFTEHIAVTFQEFGPESSTFTNYGTEPADYPYPEVDYWDWGIWDNKIFGFQSDPYDDAYAYYLLDYVPGTTSDPPVYNTGVWSEDIGFATRDYWDFPFPICWQGLTNVFVCVINSNVDNPNAWDAFVVSDQGRQIIRGLFTLPATDPNRPWEPDPAAIIPDPENNCNWLIIFNNDVHTASINGSDTGWSMLYHQCFSSIDGHIISENYYQFEASDACSNLFYGLVSWGGNMYPLLSTPDYFRIYSGMGWWGDQSDESTEYPRGNCVVSIAKDCSHYTVDYMVPKDGDLTAFGELNNMNPSGYYTHDRQGKPYYMGWGFPPNYDFGPVLSTTTLDLVSLYPFHRPTSEYAFTAESNFDPSFTQFSISVWCCQNVHIQSPAITPPGFTALPLLPGGGQGSAEAISADGRTAVGWAMPAGGDISFHLACYWTDLGDPVAITAPDAYSEAYGVSADGSVIAGNSNPDGTFRPFRWTAATGAVSFGLPNDTVSGMSADASRIIGGTYLGDITNQGKACFWDSTFGRTDLGVLPGHNTSWATDISADGTFIVGDSYVGSSLGTDTSTMRAFLWTAASGMVNLGVVAGAVSSNATSVSDDGTLVIGSSGGAMFTWTPTGGMVTNPSFNGLWVSGDGSTIVGNAPYAAPNYIWPDSFAYTASKGVVVPPPIPLDPRYPDVIQYTTPFGVSADGKTMVGETPSGGDLTNPTLPWLYHVPSPPTPPAITMDFSPEEIAITIYGVDGSLRFSGLWTVQVPNIEYQVLFSVDTSAQIYSLYVNDIGPSGTPTWGDPGTIGWAS